MKLALFMALLVGLSGTYSSAAPVAAEIASPGVKLQNANSYAFAIGDVTVIALSDGTVPQDLHELLHRTTNQKTDALLKKGFLVNPVETSINAYLVLLGDKRVLVYTGAGDFFGPGYGGKLLESLALAQVKPEQITDILLTHAHDDHMGGLVHHGKLAFPNAIVHFSKADLDFFLDKSNAEKTHTAKSYFDQAETALKPEVDAGKIKSFAGTTDVLPGITASAHPGHTPGSVFYTLTSRGQSLIFVGDIMHVAPVQTRAPGITIAYDVDESKAASVRAQAFADFAKSRALIAVPHVSFPGVGHVEKVGQEYRWIPVEYGNRELAAPSASADPHKNGDK